MKDRLSRKAAFVDVPTVLQTVKERLIEKRFNIDTYDRLEGLIRARRNSLDMVVVGAYRRTEISVNKDEKDNINVDLSWGGMVNGAMVTFLELFLISSAMMKGMGTTGALISVLIGLMGACFNVITFNYLRARFRYVLSRDIRDLNDESRSKEEE